MRKLYATLFYVATAGMVALIYVFVITTAKTAAFEAALAFGAGACMLGMIVFGCLWFAADPNRDRIVVH